MSAQKADRRLRGQPARPRTPAAALPGGKGEISKPSCGSWFCASWCCGSGEMKLHCEVEVVSRHLPALGLRNRGKGVRAVLTLCQQTPKSQPRPQAGGERGGPHPAYLLISTLKDKRGTRYELKENIDQFFTKFVDEGKATVRLKEPPVDICLSKANSSSLKGFLSAVKLAYRGCDIDAPLSNPIPVKTSEFEKFKTKMVITSKKDYPLSKNFPHSLEHLQTSYCGLVRVDLRMLCLKNLRKLDLSHNHIKKLPATIGDLIHLQELNLSDNHLESFSVALCQSTLKKSLRSLDLSKNKIKALPVQFCQLRELTDLKLDDNELIRFPFKIGQLTNLRFLSAARNKLPFLPSEFKNLFLEYLDLFGNTFEQPKVLPVIMLQTPLTLLESSARTILYNRIPYGSNIIPFHLCQDLDTAKTCVCGRYCLSCFIQGTTTMNLHSVAHTVVLVDNMGGTEAPVLSYFCSLGCYINSCDTLK
ncbi:leucine-rich repeat protein 1 isoform X2 [Rousettus aegyptiacus]|uniref:Leucine-rich repeat protein 1 n=1 Tax=Rousettus aegyptiacus TaxID=9407 RepID=A0A7J8IPB4_ROUAE|nr:leucine-rich repeat protein 1 isoform X2 [Rousettus aegyptiacus]KAF6485732.1 leucine rich repeat protein 1 [Rousettus aegyptiacus]